jgi:uncharacterized cupin superfamily protein
MRLVQSSTMSLEGQNDNRVTGVDSFHVIEGEAELETSDGEKIELIAGGIYSFPDGFSATWRTRSPFLKFFVIA